MGHSRPEYIVIGTVMSLWGMHGHVKVDVETDFPERFSPSSRVYLDRRPVTIESVNWHKGRAIVKIEGLDDDRDTGPFIGKLVEIHHTQLHELPEGEYYHFELVGLKVKTTSGDSIGELKEVMTMSSADIYVVQGGNGDILLPATDEVVKSVDTENGVMIIEVLDGLLDLNERESKKE
ncbi:MAG: 16S rRNA processing protein RimM [Dehalococcoidales bacterium]|nr:16S rRNA processing protein RimM [Dehalococcoidales bacterium]